MIQIRPSKFCIWSVLLVGLRIGVFADDPSGYSAFFRTNLDEFEDRQLTFRKPIPNWIRGTLIRNGAGRFEMGPRKVNHVFDAYGKLHSFKFYGNGSVSFSAKLLRTEYYNKSISINNIAPYLLFEPVTPRFNALEVTEAFIHNMDNTNVNVYRIYNKTKRNFEYMTLNDIWKVYQIDPRSLDTVSAIVPKVRFNKLVFVTVTSSAHPVKEYGKENYITFLTSISKMPTVKSQMTLFRMNTVATREEIVTWEIEENRYIHSFAVTKHYVILFAPPIFISASRLFTHGNVWEAMEWNGKAPLIIYLIDINSTKVTTLKYETLFFFHNINAYEDNDSIIADICAFDNSSIVKIFELESLLHQQVRDNMQFAQYIKRITIDLKTLSVRGETIASSPEIPYSTKLDFPTINENFRHLKYCYVYGQAVKIDNVNFNKYAIVKKDLCESRGDKSWTLDNNYPSEVWFVPTPNGNREDDGILIAHVFDGILKETYLVLINATSMELMSRSTLPTTIPMSFHGRFFPEDDITL